MKRLFLFTSAAVAALLTVAPARAGLVQWSYDWQRSPLVVGAGTGGVSFTNEPKKDAVGPSDIVATNLRIFSSAKADAPDTIVNGLYHLTLTLFDKASNTQGALEWDGQLAGTFSASSAHVTNSFITIQTQTLKLGNAATGFRNYVVTIGPYAHPGPPTAANAGSIGATVDITAVKPDGGNSPEPASLLLAGLGLSLLSGAAYRRRRLALRLA